MNLQEQLRHQSPSSGLGLARPVADRGDSGIQRLVPNMLFVWQLLFQNPLWHGGSDSKPSFSVVILRYIWLLF